MGDSEQVEVPEKLEKDEAVVGASVSDKTRRKPVGLTAGQAVVIQGLAPWERRHLNGQTGVLARRELSGRWRVQLDVPLCDESPRGAQVRREPGTGRLLVESTLEDVLQHSEPQWTVTVSPTALSAIGPPPESEEVPYSPQRPSGSPKSPWRPPKSLQNRPPMEWLQKREFVVARREMRGLSGAGAMQLAKIRHAGRKIGRANRHGKAAMAEVSPLPPISSAHLVQRTVVMQEVWSDKAKSVSAGQSHHEGITTHFFSSATQAIDGLCAHFQYEGDRAFRPSFPTDVLALAAQCDLHELTSNVLQQCSASEQHDPLENDHGKCTVDDPFENDHGKCTVDDPFLEGFLATGGEDDGMM